MFDFSFVLLQAEESASDSEGEPSSHLDNSKKRKFLEVWEPLPDVVKEAWNEAGQKQAGFCVVVLCGFEFNLYVLLLLKCYVLTFVCQVDLTPTRHV